jgi:uncharacterized membrane protein YeaQ/YmgE (transglycosylase-associated protein family)
MFGFLGMILSGLIVGALAKFLMPGKDPGGWFITILLGIAGSIVGGFLGRTLGFYREGEAAGWILSTVGALLILWVYRLVKSRKAAGS